MAENVVEAVLSSRFEDRVTAALERTTNNVARIAKQMNSGLALAGQALAGLVAGGVVAGAALLGAALRNIGEFAAQTASKVVELSAAAIEQGSHLRSLGGTYEFARDKLTLYLTKLAVAIQSGGVFQELMGKIERAVLRLDPSKDQLNELTLASNRFFLSFTEGTADALRGIGPFVSGMGAIARAIRIVIDGGLVLLGLALQSILNLVRLFTAALSFVPGEVGRFFESITEKIATQVAIIAQRIGQASDSFLQGFSGVGDTEERLNKLADEISRTARELRGFEGDVRKVNPAAVAAKSGIDALNRSLERERDLLFDIAGDGADESLRLQLQFLQRLDRINKLEAADEIDKNALIELARRSLNQQLAELDARRLHAKKLANDKLLDEDRRLLREIEELKARADRAVNEQLEKTAQANLAILPALQTAKLGLTDFQQFMLRFTETVTDAWSNFWADLVSGQDGAFKKLMAALLNFIADEIQAHAFRLAKLAFVNFLLGNYGKAAAQAAGAAALGVAAGVLRGAAANLADTTRGLQGSGTFQRTPAPAAAGATRIDVGASGGAQSAGAARAQLDRQPPQQVIVQVRAQRGFIAEQVIETIQGRNTRLREALGKA